MSLEMIATPPVTLESDASEGTSDLAVTELTSLELALVGGGQGMAVFA